METTFENLTLLCLKEALREAVGGGGIKDEEADDDVVVEDEVREALACETLKLCSFMKDEAM